VTGLDERLRLFEPLLDELAAEFRLEAIGPVDSWGDPVSDAYHRCEETGSAAERLGASMAWYWASPTQAQGPRCLPAGFPRI
jgi:hypothetical protein